MTQTQNPQELLESLKDVDGLTGSFLINLNGELVGRDMPSMFDNETLKESAPRVQRIFDALEADGSDYHTCILNFGEHRLFIRKFVHGNLCTLIGERANVPALKMATNLITKRLNQSGLPLFQESLEEELQPEIQNDRQAEIPQRPSSNHSEQTPSKARYYRGVKIN